MSTIQVLAGLLVWFAGLVCWFGLLVWFAGLVCWFGLLVWFVCLKCRPSLPRRPLCWLYERAMRPERPLASRLSPSALSPFDLFFHFAWDELAEEPLQLTEVVHNRNFS
jgi:hypothetical protein